MDLSPFSLFEYRDYSAWQTFLLVNSASHENYNAALQLAGGTPLNYPLVDIGDTHEAKQDWLTTHYLMHQQLADAVGIIDLPDLSDLELHSEDQFSNWLQLHMQQHQLIDALLNL